MQWLHAPSVQEQFKAILVKCGGALFTQYCTCNHLNETDLHYRVWKWESEQLILIRQNKHCCWRLTSCHNLPCMKVSKAATFGHNSFYSFLLTSTTLNQICVAEFGAIALENHWVDCVLRQVSCSFELAATFDHRTFCLRAAAMVVPQTEREVREVLKFVLTQWLQWLQLL